ncbi:MAG TPA: hypothetical protein VK681_39200 [Reyranella sp.]|nr:hypothetical protein [Reyranella sp.]
MTWIRWDVATPRSEVVLFLADRLKIQQAHALGHYNAMCCAFGEHRQDGRIDQVPDIALESWALWRGKEGQFAKAMREWCPDGDLRGWWRQEKLLARREQDKKKPSGSRPPIKPPEVVEGKMGEKWGKSEAKVGATDGTNERTNVPAAAVDELVGRIFGQPDRHAVVEWFEKLPASTDQDTWARRFLMWLEGVDRPEGRPCSVASLCKALADFPLIEDRSLSPEFLAGCIRRAERVLAKVTALDGSSWTAAPPKGEVAA